MKLARVAWTDRRLAPLRSAPTATQEFSDASWRLAR